MPGSTTRDIVLRMEGKLDALINKVSTHDVDLNGNGKPGLKACVRDLQTDVNTIKEQHKDQKNFSRQVGLLAIGEVLTVIGLAVALIFGLR